jgi:hypothetical protein
MGASTHVSMLVIVISFVETDPDLDSFIELANVPPAFFVRISTVATSIVSVACPPGWNGKRSANSPTTRPSAGQQHTRCSKILPLGQFGRVNPLLVSPRLDRHRCFD